jgi:hypothetical protein
MDLQKAKMLLDKINALHKGMNIEAGDIAAIERDLMLSYIRQLYEAYLDDAPQQKTTANSTTAKTQKNKPELEIVAPKPTPPKPKKKAYKPPRIIEIPDAQKEVPPPPKLAEAKTEPAQPKPAAKQPVAPPPPPAPNPKVQNPKPKTQHPTSNIVDAPKGFEQLFEHHAAKELSEKLGERPIQDLTKALAINDRLLYMNELFGKNMDALNQSLNQLNQFNSIDAAKPLLANLAKTHNWIDEEKLEIAKDFIKIVRRRYV